MITVNQTTLANVEHYRIDLDCYCAITSHDTTFWCSKKFVLFGEHAIEGILLYSACLLPFVYGLKLNATLFLRWDVHQITQIFLSI
jgi:hypothetical protein